MFLKLFQKHPEKVPDPDDDVIGSKDGWEGVPTTTAESCPKCTFLQKSFLEIELGFLNKIL